jgi:hypothetical protein
MLVGAPVVARNSLQEHLVEREHAVMAHRLQRGTPRRRGSDARPSPRGLTAQLHAVRERLACFTLVVSAALRAAYLPDFLSVSRPVANGISKRVYRHTSQEVCPWNVSFASELQEPAFAARGGLDANDARVIAREFLAMSQGAFSTRFKGSAMKRAKRRGLARNAAVVLGNVEIAEDVPLLEAALQHEELIVRAHAAWAVGRIASRPRSRRR